MAIAGYATGSPQTNPFPLISTSLQEEYTYLSALCSLNLPDEACSIIQITGYALRQGIPGSIFFLRKLIIMSGQQKVFYQSENRFSHHQYTVNLIQYKGKITS